MNKDALLASVIGFGIGLLITGAVIAGPKLMSQLKQTQGDVASANIEDKTDTTPTPTANHSTDVLTIDSPTKEAIVSEDSIAVSGKAPKNAIIVVGSAEEEIIVETKETTTYSATVKLKEGKNEISVMSLVDGTQKIERVTIYYSEEN